MISHVIRRETSDHNVVISEIQCDKLIPRRQNNKEMFFSNLLNEPKQKHVKHYLRYILRLVSKVMNGNDMTM